MLICDLDLGFRSAIPKSSTFWWSVILLEPDPATYNNRPWNSGCLEWNTELSEYWTSTVIRCDIWLTLMVTLYFSAKKTVNILILGHFRDGCGNNTTANRIRCCTDSKMYNFLSVELMSVNKLSTSVITVVIWSFCHLSIWLRYNIAPPPSWHLYWTKTKMKTKTKIGKCC